jgi:type I restriction enzyme R subunit
MKNAGVIGAESPSPRITSAAEFVQKLGRHAALLCALIHKFDAADLKGDPAGAGASTCSWTSATARRAAT